MTHEGSWEARSCMVGATLAVALAVCVKHTVELLVPPEPMHLTCGRPGSLS
jgi:hypothetical protein